MHPSCRGASSIMKHFLLIILAINIQIALIACNGAKATPVGLTDNRQGFVVLNNSEALSKQLSARNTKYIIQEDLNLKGGRLSIPEGCVLYFEGGSLYNGVIVYNNTYLDGNIQIHCNCEGNLANDVVSPSMYGAYGNGINDDSDAIQKAINSGKNVFFKRATYVVEKPIVLVGQNIVVDFNLATITKKNGRTYTYKFKGKTNITKSVLIIQPHESNTSGHIVLKNLQLQGNYINNGIEALWCRNVIMENVRISKTNTGLLYSGFTNSFRDITIWDSKVGFDVDNSTATLFERCFSTKCGWSIKKSNATLICCSSDDFDPCYRFESSVVAMTGCTFESKGVGMDTYDSSVDMNGEFELHVYDSTKEVSFIKAHDNSNVICGNSTFRLNNYLKKKIPSSSQFEASGCSSIAIDGKVRFEGNKIHINAGKDGKILYKGKDLATGIHTL